MSHILFLGSKTLCTGLERISILCSRPRYLLGGNVLLRHWKRREPSRKGDFTNCHFLRQKCRAGERFRSTSLVWWEKSIATWHGAIIAEGGTIFGGSASQTLRLVPMGWIKLLQTWSHERLALMLGFGDSEKLGTGSSHEDAQISCWQVSIYPTSRQHICHP